MSSMSTCLSVFTDPARLRIDRVFARTLTSPSGVTPLEAGARFSVKCCSHFYRNSGPFFGCHC